jgi:uncharacterized OB-fold protein
MSEPSRHTVTSTLEFPYRRSLGPVMGGFMTALRDHKLMGIRNRGGDVICPPLEHDPATGEDLGTDLVEVGPGGEVTSWTWVGEPSPRHPIDHPFAFALIRLDGASTALVHLVDADMTAMHTGMRVVPRWRGEPEGKITDIEAFVPERS